MISYTDAQMEQERNDPKWLVVNGVKPAIIRGLMVDVTEHGGTITEGLEVSDTYWVRVHKYRLHNGPGYKNGIAIDEQAGCKITELKEQGEWVDGEFPPIRMVCLLLTGGDPTKVRILGNINNGDMWLDLLEDNELMTETCMTPDMFRPILTPKQRTIEAAKKLSVKCIYDAVNHGGLGAVTQSEKLYDVLYDAGFLVLPGEGSCKD